MKTLDGLKNLPQAWVVFFGDTDIAWLKILKPGFRHCAVLMDDGQNWITIDPLSNYTDVTVHPFPHEFNLPLWMRDTGHKVVPAQITRSMRPAPIGIYSCVEAVKRVLGLHCWQIITPWQLYRHLRKTENLRTFGRIKSSKGDTTWEV